MLNLSVLLLLKKTPTNSQGILFTLFQIPLFQDLTTIEMSPPQIAHVTISLVNCPPFSRVHHIETITWPFIAMKFSFLC